MHPFRDRTRTLRWGGRARKGASAKASSVPHQHLGLPRPPSSGLRKHSATSPPNPQGCLTEPGSLESVQIVAYFFRTSGRADGVPFFSCVLVHRPPTRSVSSDLEQIQTRLSSDLVPHLDLFRPPSVYREGRKRCFPLPVRSPLPPSPALAHAHHSPLPFTPALLSDIPLFADEAKTVLNMIVEVPRWTNVRSPFYPSSQPSRLSPSRPNTRSHLPCQC